METQTTSKQYIRIIPTRANKLLYHIRTLLLLIETHKNNLACYPEGCYYDIIYSKLLKEVYNENTSVIQLILNSTDIINESEKKLYLHGYMNINYLMNPSETQKVNEDRYKPIQYLLHRVFVVIDTIREIFTELCESYMIPFNTNIGLNHFDNQEATIIIDNAETFEKQLGIYKNIIRVMLFEPFECNTFGIVEYYNSIIEIYRELVYIKYALDLDLIDTDEIEILDFKYLYIRDDVYVKNIDIHLFLIDVYIYPEYVLDKVRFREQWYREVTYMDDEDVDSIDDWGIPLNESEIRALFEKK